MATNYLIGYWTVFWVHFMALLTIPSIGLLYFFKHYKTVTVKKLHHCQRCSYFNIVYFQVTTTITMSFFAGTEVFTVNELGMPFDSERF
jgi:hypothetical protein